MAGVNHTLRGSTLMETLVMMLVAGIVFLAAMEALTLVSRLVAQRAAVLVETGRQRDGFGRIAQLFATADSVCCKAGECDGSERLLLYRAGHEAALTAGDSVVLYAAGGFRDTLLRRVERMRLVRCGAEADTLEIDVEGHVLKFPVQRPARIRYETAVAEIEKDHGYEDS